MKFGKLLCNIIFIIILILFTVGYNLSIINANVNISISGIAGSSSSSDTSVQKYILYINNIVNQSTINNVTTNNTIKYTDISSVIDTIFMVIKYLCIGISSSIVAGIIFSFFGLKILSKILFILSLILMIIISVILIIIINISFIKNTIISFVTQKLQSIYNLPNINTTINNTSINYETGGILISIASALMLINYILYAFIG